MKVNKLISPSDISIYETCPRQFYYKIMGYPMIEPPTPPYFKFGSDIHELLSTYYKELKYGEGVINPVEMIYSIARRRGIVIEGRVKRIIDRWLDFEETRISEWGHPKPILVEEVVEKPPFKGIVDLMVKKGNEKVVVDWKTGGYSGYLSYSYQIQGTIYKYITDADEVIFFFLDSGNMEFITDYEINLEEVIRPLLEDDVYPMKIGEHCNDCSFELICRLHRQGLNGRKLLYMTLFRE